MSVVKPSHVASLRREARWIHQVVFGRELDASIVDEYVSAHDFCFPDPDKRFANMVRRIVDRGLDIEAIEFAMRVRRGRTELTNKIQILFYLVEVRPSYYSAFIDDGQGRWRAIISILLAGPHSAWKFLRGNYLIWKHELA